MKGEMGNENNTCLMTNAKATVKIEPKKWEEKNSDCCSLLKFSTRQSRTLSFAQCYSLLLHFAALVHCCCCYRTTARLGQVIGLFTQQRLRIPVIVSVSLARGARRSGTPVSSTECRRNSSRIYNLSMVDEFMDCCTNEGCGVRSGGTAKMTP